MMCSITITNPAPSEYMKWLLEIQLYGLDSTQIAISRLTAESQPDIWRTAARCIDGSRDTACMIVHHTTVRYPCPSGASEVTQVSVLTTFDDFQAYILSYRDASGSVDRPSTIFRAPKPDGGKRRYTMVSNAGPPTAVRHQWR